MLEYPGEIYRGYVIITRSRELSSSETFNRFTGRWRNNRPTITEQCMIAKETEPGVFDKICEAASPQAAMEIIDGLVGGS